MRSFIFIILIFFVQSLNGQFYGHKLFDISDIDPAPTGLFINPIDDRLMVPNIYDPGDTSTIITFDFQGNNRLDFEIDSFFFARSTFVHLNGSNYFYGKVQSIPNNLQIIKLDANYQPTWRSNFSTDLEVNIPVDIVSLGSNLYITSTNTTLQGQFHREITTKKVNAAGQEIWSENYNTSSFSSNIAKIVVSSDNHLMLSTGVANQPSQIDGKSQLIKIDTLGNIIWQVLGTEKISSSVVEVNLIELPNGNFLQIYEVDKTVDENYSDTLYPRPIRMDWYDNMGILLSSKYIEYSASERFFREDVVSGNGAYFFIVGSHGDVNIPGERYGTVTKFDYQGDTVWTKQYNHPDYTEITDFNIIRNLVELDNGDLLLSGSVFNENGNSQVWFLRVNEHGCFGNTSCDDIVTSTEKDINLSLIDVKVFPNPASLKLHVISSFHLIQKVKLYNFNGQLVNEQYGYGQSEMEIAVDDYPNGVYILALEFRNGEIVTETVQLEGKQK